MTYNCATSHSHSLLYIFKVSRCWWGADVGYYAVIQSMQHAALQSLWQYCISNLFSFFSSLITSLHSQQGREPIRNRVIFFRATFLIMENWNLKAIFLLNVALFNYREMWLKLNATKRQLSLLCFFPPSLFRLPRTKRLQMRNQSSSKLP